MDIYEQAVGDCIVCGEGAAGSLYWTPLPAAVWVAVRPHLAPIFRSEDFVQNVLFIEGQSKPFCGAQCSLDHNRKEAA